LQIELLECDRALGTRSDKALFRVPSIWRGPLLPFSASVNAGRRTWSKLPLGGPD